MNFNFYILGTPEGRYNQYPDDYTAPILVGMQKNLKGSRLVIHREMNLIQYVYTEQIGSNNFIGFCLIFNNIRLLKPKQLIKLFRLIIEERLVNSGRIIRYVANGELQFNIKLFSEEIKEIESLKVFINTELEVNEEKYEIEVLKTIYNGVKSSDTIDINSTDSEIILLSNQYNTVFVSDDMGIENGYIHQVITSIREQNIAAKKEIEKLQDEIVKLKRQKKQYNKVILLFLLMIICSCGLFFLNVNLNNTKNILEQTQKMLEESEQVNVLRKDSIRMLNCEKENIESEYSNFKSLLTNVFPFIIDSVEVGNVDNDFNLETDYGAVIYSKNTMFLAPCLYYKGLKEVSITLYVRLYTSDGMFSNATISPNGYTYSCDVTVYSGNNTVKLPGWGGRNRGYWCSGSYRYEIWYNNVCLKAKTFTIY
ncbi:hypothetical protein [Parabacteroides timonensis]|uniref:hypothetical protein n=1 Tax=Parabacteroides timonensis TaxID=1871013 RepID=UPI00094EAA9B|nr:hypothetical protein [Parabacteroides timonensis]